ncbi:hypothetical protein MJI37_35655, partial [Salmonella enterica subsp. enterica serovar Cerro]|nr:hypothetical protein [Salmonella enterica subsp. enterica serovar Cerro]
STQHILLLDEFYRTAVRLAGKRILWSMVPCDEEEHYDDYVMTNCTYDGVCYNAKEAQDLLAKTSDRIHFDEAWYGYARFNPI